MSRPAAGSRRGLPGASGVAVPADKRFRRSDVRPGRRRRLGLVAWRIARWAVPALLVAALLAGGASMLLDSRWLRVGHIVVRGTSRLSMGEVETLIAGIREENIFRVDFERYRRRLMDSPWVANVALSRVLPSTVELQVTERVPMVVARLRQQLYLVDDGGVIIDEFGPQYRDFDLPIIDGLVSPPASGGPLVDAERLQLVHTFLTSLSARPDMRRRLSQVDVADARDVTVMFDDDTTWLHLGDRQFVERLTNYLELASTLHARFEELDAVDLRFDDRVYVRSRDSVVDAGGRSPRRPAVAPGPVAESATPGRASGGQEK